MKQHTAGITLSRGTSRAKASERRSVGTARDQVSKPAPSAGLHRITTEVEALRRLLEDLGYKQKSATVLFEDNAACITRATRIVL